MKIYPHTFRLAALSILLSVVLPAVGTGEETAAHPRQPAQPAASQATSGSGGNTDDGISVYRAEVEPHWFMENSRFWYRNVLPGGASEFILVDAAEGTRERAFDHATMAESLSEAVGESFQADQLPFREIEFIDDASAIVVEVADKKWRYDLTDFSCTPFESDGERTEQENETRSRSGNSRYRDRRSREEVSPNGEWTAFVKDHNVYLRRRNGGDPIALSHDGEEGFSYRNLEWSPNSSFLIAWRVEEVEQKQVHLIRSSPPGGGRAVLESRPYALPGDPFPRYEPNIFQVAERTQLKPDVDLFEHQWLSPELRWSSDGERFIYEQVGRGHQRFRVIEIDAVSGDIRFLVDERTDTFIWTHHTENVDLDRVTWLESTDEFIYASEMSGWRHLYLVDSREGSMNPITSGDWVVRGIEWIDEEKRQICFTASGRNPDQDPYFIHYYRINFDGSGLVALTEANGNHRVEFSPDRRYLIATHSRVDSPPVTELRRGSDGELIVQLEKADISELVANGWTPPEVFVAKGRDGKTDIWGIIARPRDYDPSLKYPVIEDIYAGPQSSYVPKSFSSRQRYESLTDLGFIVVKIDGMGTANRSKAFHDVAWHNLKDAGFPDRILWMKAAAEEDPAMDLTRVGVYGNSAGGQNAAGAVLFHPEFYKAAVASCGCHDNRMDKASWNEQWMGYPVGPQYAESSNIENAHRLQGALLLIVGEMDRNVPPESTLRFVDALIRAEKDFELLVIPNGGHGMGGAYGHRRMQDFFIRHLTDREPPNRNITTIPESSEVAAD